MTTDAAIDRVHAELLPLDPEKASNLLGFLRRCSGSVHYREPPRDGLGSYEPDERVKQDMLALARIAVRVAHAKLAAQARRDRV